VCRLWILAESRVHLKEFEVQEDELNDTLSTRVQEHKDLEEKVVHHVLFTLTVHFVVRPTYKYRNHEMIKVSSLSGRISVIN